MAGSVQRSNIYKWLGVLGLRQVSHGAGVSLAGKIFHSSNQIHILYSFCGWFGFMFELEKSNKLLTLHSLTVEILPTIITLWFYTRDNKARVNKQTLAEDRCILYSESFLLR